MNKEEHIQSEVEKTMNLLDQKGSMRLPANFSELVIEEMARRDNKTTSPAWRIAAMIAFIIANGVSYTLLEANPATDEQNASEVFISSYDLEGQNYTWSYE